MSPEKPHLTPAQEQFDDEMTTIIVNLASNSDDPEMKKIAEDISERTEAGQELLDVLRAYDEEHFGPLE